ncbi:MAG: ATP-grasp domain-containing protein [Nitrospirota bacterium]|nr:ATP-grasp domain-containing protein [Nitrospirota bacterium]
MPCFSQKRLLLVGAGQEQLAAIQAARELGLFTIALDGNAKAPGLKQADLGYCMDIRDVSAVTKIGKEADIEGVFSHALDLPQVVASVTQSLGLPGLDPDIALRATNKFLRYQCFQENHIPCPQFYLVDSIQAAYSQAEVLGFPLVMKPLDNAGARGVRKVNGPDEIEESFHWALQFSHEPSVLLEEFLEGQEISTESVIVDGRITTTGFADRNYSKKEWFAPYFIEDGHTIPTTLSAADQARVLKLVEQAIQALGIRWGVAKGDVILTSSGPKIFEMAPRTSGGRFCADMVPLATGVNILKPLIQMALDEKISEEDLSPKFDRGAAQRFVFPSVGTVVAIGGLPKARQLPGVYDVVLQDQFTVGSVVSAMRHHGDRVGHVIAQGATRERAIERADHAIRTIRIETASLVGVGS